MNVKLKKIDQAVLFLKQNLHLFKCPYCDAAFKDIDEYSIVCIKNHRFDLSKKGTLYLLKRKTTNDYDNQEMWTARRNLLQHGFFDGILELILAHFPDNDLNVLDAGCGEGTALSELSFARKKFNDNYIGFDLSKEAINLATQQEMSNFFCIADITALPFQNDSFDVLLDILTPSAYQEFNRVLKTNGMLLKVIPNSHYLIELRHRLYTPDDPNYSYDNQAVLKHFKEMYPNSEIEHVKYKFPLNAKLAHDLVKMTPLQWGSSMDEKEILKTPLEYVTVDFSLLIAYCK